jgi:hypothetical protein
MMDKQHNKNQAALVMVILMAMVTLFLAGCGSINAGIVDAAPDEMKRPRIVEVTAPAPRPTNAPIHDVRSTPSPGDEEVVKEDKVISDDEIADESVIPVDDTIVEDTPEEVPEMLVVESTLEDLDATWNLYTNLTLGYEILVPKQMALFNGDCTYNEVQGSYRPKFGMVNTAIFEDGNSTFLSYAQYADLQGEKVNTFEDGGQRSDFSECVTVSTTLEMIKNEEILLQWWEIKVTEVADETALLDLMKAQYGSGCELSEMAATDQEGTYDLDIVRDGKHFTESTCPVNFGVEIRYAPELGKVAIWNTGQAWTFVADETYSVIHDPEMSDSFRFLP